MKLNFHLLKGSLVGALGGLLFGFDTAVIAGTTHALTIQYALSPRSLGVTVFIALAGTVIGALSAGVPGQKYGGRDTLRFLAICYCVSAIGCAMAWSWTALLVFRFIGGVGIGGSSVLGPVYIAEIAPAKWRGRLVGTFQINIVIGILLAYLSNYAIASWLGGPEDWRWMFGVSGIPAFLFLVLLFTIPQSPRWLATQNRAEEAHGVLTLIGAEDPEGELAEIMASIHLERSRKQERLFSRKYAFPLFLAITLGAFNQLSGINAILYYLSDIFSKAGFSQISGDLQSVGVGAMNLIATLAAMTVIDKIGRKALLLIGSVGMAISLGGVAAVFITHSHQQDLLWCLLGFIASFAISQGAVVWVYIGEVFPNQVRAKGQSAGSSAHWIMNATISLIFPVLAERSGGYPFVFFAAMMVVQFFLVLFFFPETKGVSLEELQHHLGLD